MTTFERDGDVLRKTIETEAQTFVAVAGVARHLRLSVEDGSVATGGTDTETVTVEVVSGLDRARGETPAAVLAEDHTATLSVDGSEQSVAVSGGSGSIGVTTTRPAGATIEVEAVGLDGVPASGETIAIEVTQA